MKIGLGTSFAWRPAEPRYLSSPRSPARIQTSAYSSYSLACTRVTRRGKPRCPTAWSCWLPKLQQPNEKMQSANQWSSVVIPDEREIAALLTMERADRLCLRQGVFYPSRLAHETMEASHSS